MYFTFFFSFFFNLDQRAPLGQLYFNGKGASNRYFQNRYGTEPTNQQTLQTNKQANKQANETQHYSNKSVPCQSLRHTIADENAHILIARN